MPCTVFGSHFSFTSEEASECRKLWKPKRTRSSSLMTPALISAGRRYFCTMIETDNGFLPFSRKLGKTKSSSFAYGVLSFHAPVRKIGLREERYEELARLSSPQFSSALRFLSLSLAS